MASLAEDEELRLAIQMSLESNQEALSQPSEGAGDMSHQREHFAEPCVDSKKRKAESSLTNSPAKTQHLASGLLGLDRRQMERERLDRLSRTTNSHRPISPPELRRRERSSCSNGPPAAKSVWESVEPPVKRQKHEHTIDSTGSIVIKDDSAEPILSIQEEMSKSPSHLPYPTPTVKRTWAKGKARDNDITFDELVRKEELRKAMLSSYMWDHDWLFKKLDPAKTDLLMVVQAKTLAEQEEIRNEGRATNPRIKLCFPPMPGQVNCMHSKLMLLFYDTYMRVAVPSANLTEYDWGDTGVMENTVFLVDLPLKSSDTAGFEGLPSFATSLLYFLQKTGVPESLRAAVKRHDFKATKGIAFVHSVGGSHFGDDLYRNGYPGLSRAIGELGIDTSLHVQVDFASASLGSLSKEYLQLIYLAAQGRQSSEGEIRKTFKQSADQPLAECFRIYFPTYDTVAKSLGGVNAAGTICLQSKWYHGEKFPKSLLRDYQSSREGLLSHNKLLLVRGQRATPSTVQRSIAWLYTGSANLSESAWGKVVQDRSKGHPLKLNCRNWECGVVVPVRINEERKEIPSTDIFGETLTIPFKTPGSEYSNRKPWFFIG